MPSGRQPTVHGDRVDAERSGSVPDVAPQEPADVLVGRARELTAIATAMTAARRGRARVGHLVGEPGIGKTALAEHAAVLASEQGWMVAWGRAWAADAAPPYWLWQQVLGSLVRTTNVSTRVHPATAAWLVDLVPELAGAGEVPPAPALDPDRARMALQRAVVHVLGTAAADRPLLVVLDDVHGADGASLALANLVCRSLPDSPLLVLTTQRPAGPAGDAVDQEVLATVAGLPPGRFADAVAEAVATGILWCRSSEHPSCGFVHVLLREAARAEVDADVRRALHLEIATALEALPGRPERLAEVAHHYRAALPAGDPQVMVDRTIAAGEEALRVFAHEAAIAQCTAGLTTLGSYGSAGPVRQWRARLLGVLGEAQRYAGDLVRARQTLVDAHALATGAGDPVRAAAAASRMPRLTQFLVPDRELESMLTG